MDTKYNKWAELEKECEEEERQERAQKKRERDAMKAKAAEAGYAKPKDMEQAYSQAFEKNKKDMKITHEEEAKFKKAFKDPKFRTLMDEYMEEISDPKHREEQNAYIKQLENDGKTPEGKEFMQPKSGFAVKTRKDDKAKSKMFLNIVHSERVEEATMKKTDKGAQWSLPYTLGPMRQEKDKGGGLVPAIDCCYHTNTLARAMKDPRFKKMIVNTALDAVEKTIKDVQMQTVNLDRNYHIIKGVQYKNGDPVTMMLSKKSAGEKFPNATKGMQESAAKKKQIEDNAASAEPDPMAATADELADDDDKPKTVQGLFDILKEGQKEKFGDEADAGAESAKKPKKKPKPALKGGFISKQIKAEEKRKKKKLDKRKKRDGPEKPEYKLVERGAFDMAKFLNNDLLAFVSSQQRPKELVAHVTLPLLKSAATVDLDVSERKLIVSDEKDYYKLDVALPYPVLEDQGSAKFDKVKRVLSVTMPVKGLTKAEQEQIKADAASLQKAQMAIKEVEGVANAGEDAGEEDATSDPAVVASADGVVGIPYSKEEKEARRKQLQEEEAKHFKSKVEEVDPEKEHGTWAERGKEAVLMRKTDKEERDKKQISERWVPHEDPTAKDEVQDAIAQAKEALRKEKIRKAARKEKKKEEEAARAETEAKMKRQALMKAASLVKKQQRKHLYDDAEAPPFVFKQNASTVTLIVKVAGASEDTLLFETPDDRTVSLVFSAFEASADGDCEEVEKMYRLQFHTFAPIDARNCTYKLASRNMVVVLSKVEKGETWDALEGAVGSRLWPVVEPRMIFKQNASAATMLLQVAGVVDESVKVDFKESMVEIRFDGDIDAKDLPADAADGSCQDLGDGKRPYKLRFAPFAAIVPAQCRFNVASRNMVVVLAKQCEGDWEGHKAAERFIAAPTFGGARKGYAFKTGADGTGYYKDEARKAEILSRVATLTNDENAGATNNPEQSPEPVPSGKIGFAKESSQKEAEGSVDAGSVTLVNQIMYELD